jgi:glyoxylase I family protein
MATPTIAKISHVSLSATDAEASAEWWERVLGFKEIDRAKGEGWFGIVLAHPDTGVVIEFQQHEANRGEPFDPARTGFDHMGFLVAEDALADWEAHLAAHGVDYTPTVRKEYGSVLTFRNPDGIQFEFFYRPDHP